MKATVHLRSADFDVFGHLNQAVYHELFEDARVAFLRQAWGAEIPQFVLARSEVDYRSEIRYGAGSAEVSMRCERLGRSSFTIASEMHHDGELAAEGRFVLVAWDASDRSSRPLSDDERRALEALVVVG